ncbi:UbiA family prenyltransferase [Streptomyces sp. SHP 1-2]|uniref:UbiA family prenyltransferase n=1 Tax=Streptomyces sp. SHP 1-2 TaxID=2769489 RepID=UPI0022371781|nr:UbiA family prenyltransferase [Streptomyces sp. SHP 1-2]
MTDGTSTTTAVTGARPDLPDPPDAAAERRPADGPLPAEGPGGPESPRPPSRPAPADGMVRRYARLGKLDVYDYYLGIPIVLAAVLATGGGITARTGLLLGVFLVAQVCLLMALVAFDDVTGFRDGSDITNYGPDHPLRNVQRKPLVAGTLTVPQALRFAWCCAVAAALLFAATYALAPHRPLWTAVGLAVLWAAALQYSYGVRISYHGFQEIYLVALGFALVVLPYGMITGRAAGLLLVQAVLFGFGPLMFGVYSNTNDVEGDRSVGRPTVAALLSERGNARFIGTLSLAEFLLVAVASATGTAPWWFLPLMLPASLLRLRQYLLGFREGDIMRARRVGFAVHRVGVALMVVSHLVVGLTS